MYLSSSTTTVSAALVRLDSSKRQRRVYFVSKALSEVEIKYSDFERVALALQMARKKLQSYFQAHTIVLLTGSLIRAILPKPDASGMILKSVVELSEFDIEYRPRTTIKGQALSNFVVERSEAHYQRVGIKKWVMETDGSSWAQVGGAEIVLRTLDEPTIMKAIKLPFVVYNNEAEYEVVILGLRVENSLSIAAIKLRCDSQLVASQLRGEYEVKNERMEQYMRIVKPFLARFKRV